MFGMGGTEIIVILIVALLFLGPDKLPQAAKSLSKGIRDIKKQSRALQQQIESDEQIGGAIRDLKSALRGEDAPMHRPYRPPKALVETTAEAPAPSGDDARPLTLPHIAGEADADASPAADAGDPDDVAALVKPASGTVAKGS
jgi:sec-independent protein translocase protein TatB